VEDVDGYLCYWDLLAYCLLYFLIIIAYVLNYFRGFNFRDHPCERTQHFIIL